MKIDLVIPTRNREKKLNDCLNSIIKARKNHKVITYVYFDSILDYHKSDVEQVLGINYEVFHDYRVPDFWNYHLNRQTCDVMVTLNDDVLLYPDTIDKLIKEYKQHFPDYDGVMGINQANLNCPNKKEGAFVVIGKVYANNFPCNQVYCPDYNRFYADYEMELYAKSINKFYYSEITKIKHLHGSFYGQDETHKNVRKWLKTDKKIFEQRQNKKYLWGKNYYELKKY